MKKNKLKFFTILLAVAFTAAACGGPKQTVQKADLVWWKVFADDKEISVLVKLFEDANPGVKIRLVEKDIATYEDELVDALAAGTGPDIFSIHNDWLPKHLNKMAAAPDSVIGLRELRENFVAAAETDLTAEDKIYALPISFDVLSLYYNKDLLSTVGVPRPPATWEELAALVPRMTRIDPLGNIEQSAIAMGTVENVNRATDILSLLMLQNDTQIFSEDRQNVLLDKSARDIGGGETQPGQRALEFYTQFSDPAKNAYTWNSRSNNSIDAFAAGRAAMILSYSYLRPVLEEKAPFLNYGIAPAPQIGGTSPRVNYPNYWAEAVSKQSQYAGSAWRFLKFVSGKEPLAAYYQNSKQVSPRLDILEEQIADPEIGVFAENAVSAKSFYKPDAAGMESIWAAMINEVVLRHVPVKDALRSATQKAELLLKNKR